MRQESRVGTSGQLIAIGRFEAMNAVTFPTSATRVELKKLADGSAAFAQPVFLIVLLAGGVPALRWG